MRIRKGLIQVSFVPVGVRVPAGPQDSSVRDAGHAGHWAQRVIEPSPVQNRITQDRMGGGGGHGSLLRLFCFWIIFFLLFVWLNELGLNEQQSFWLEELLMELFQNGVLDKPFHYYSV